MRMEMTNFWAVFTSEWAQPKFVTRLRRLHDERHVRDGRFAYYLLKRRDVKFAASSFRLAAAFGIVSSILTIHMGADGLPRDARPAHQDCRHGSHLGHPRGSGAAHAFCDPQ
ncbi:MAG: hypothetical protein ACLUHG_03785 [Sutterella wadsworthensis]